MDRAVYAKLTGKIERDSGPDIVEWLTTVAPDKGCHLHLLIDSNGGNIGAGRILHSYLRAPRSQLTVYAGRSLRSVAPVCFLGADNRVLSSDTEVIIHCARPASDRLLDESSIRADNAWMLDVLDSRAMITREERDRFLAGEDLKFPAMLAMQRGFGQRVAEFALPISAHINEFPPLDERSA